MEVLISNTPALFFTVYFGLWAAQAFGSLVVTIIRS